MVSEHAKAVKKYYYGTNIWEFYVLYCFFIFTFLFPVPFRLYRVTYCSGSWSNALCNIIDNFGLSSLVHLSVFTCSPATSWILTNFLIVSFLFVAMVCSISKRGSMVWTTGHSSTLWASLFHHDTHIYKGQHLHATSLVYLTWIMVLYLFCHAIMILMEVSGSK